MAQTKGRDKTLGFVVYLLPALLVYLIFFLYPSFQGLLFSLFRWSGFRRIEFIGLDNYTRLAKDPIFIKSLWNVLYLMAIYATVPISLGLVCAAVLAGAKRLRIPGLLAYRSIYFLPSVFTTVSVGIIFRWIAHPEYGLVNSLLGALGLGALKRVWLGDIDIAVHAIGAMSVWLQFGYAMVIFLAGIQSISDSLYEAATMDGAGAVRQFFNVTVPSLRNELTVVLVLMIIAALRSFALIMATTQGGPGNSTMVISLYAYRVAFVQNNLGFGSALMNVVSFIAVAISWFIYSKREKEL